MPTVLRALALLSALAASEAYTVSQQSDLGRLLDYTPDYTALKVAGVEHSYNAPADTCEALSGTGEARANMTKWCKKNCGFDPPNCPATLCKPLLTSWILRLTVSSSSVLSITASALRCMSPIWPVTSLKVVLCS